MKYISLLRGINVSGQKKIKMADLKALYESLGLKEVSTYIQSGNVIFSAGAKKEAVLKRMLESAIEKHYRFKVPVIIITNHQLAAILNANPFATTDLEKDGTKMLISFLSDEPSQDKMQSLIEYVKAPERLIVDGKQVYLHCPGGYGKSKLNNTFLEKKLGVEATTRNLKSVIKLRELSA
jgi:uncharacterized protein (DUF1697 family)